MEVKFIMKKDSMEIHILYQAPQGISFNNFTTTELTFLIDKLLDNFKEEIYSNFVKHRRKSKLYNDQTVKQIWSHDSIKPLNLGIIEYKLSQSQTTEATTSNIDNSELL